MNIFHQARVSNGYTQEELANKLKINRSTVAKWENGKALPRTEMLIKLSELFHCTIDELVRGCKLNEKEKV